MNNKFCKACEKPMNGGVYRYPNKCPHCYAIQDEELVEAKVKKSVSKKAKQSYEVEHIEAEVPLFEEEIEISAQAEEPIVPSNSAEELDWEDEILEEPQAVVAASSEALEDEDDYFTGDDYYTEAADEEEPVVATEVETEEIASEYDLEDFDLASEEATEEFDEELDEEQLELDTDEIESELEENDFEELGIEDVAFEEELLDDDLIEPSLQEASKSIEPSAVEELDELEEFYSDDALFEEEIIAEGLSDEDMVAEERTEEIAVAATAAEAKNVVNTEHLEIIDEKQLETIVAKTRRKQELEIELQKLVEELTPAQNDTHIDLTSEVNEVEEEVTLKAVANKKTARVVSSKELDSIHSAGLASAKSTANRPKANVSPIKADGGRDTAASAIEKLIAERNGTKVKLPASAEVKAVKKPQKKKVSATPEKLVEAKAAEKKLTEKKIIADKPAVSKVNLDSKEDSGKAEKEQIIPEVTQQVETAVIPDGDFDLDDDIAVAIKPATSPAAAPVVDARSATSNKTKTIVLTTETAHDLEIEKWCDVISYECAFSLDFEKEFSSANKNLAGVRSATSGGAVKDARKTALFGLRKEAFTLGANAVVGVNISYLNVVDNGINVVMLVATGTAVKAKLR